jgi:DNA-binding transcriptional LysR family regulator
MDIHHLRVFMAVYRRKSFSRAAEDLYLSQPTVSEHIKTLEAELGMKLFDRLGRGIIPTEEAHHLFVEAEKILDEIESIPDRIRSSSPGMHMRVEVGASTIPGTYLLPHLMAGFRKEVEGVSFRMVVGDTDNVIEMILNHEIVMGVVGAKVDDRRLRFTPFMEDELILVCSPDAGISSPITPLALKGLPFVMREEGSGTRKTMEAGLRGAGIIPEELRVSVLAGSTEAVKECVKAGLGVSFLSEVSVREEIRNGLLRAVDVEGLRIRRQFHFLTHRKRSLPRVAREFMEFCKNQGG